MQEICDAGRVEFDQRILHSLRIREGARDCLEDEAHDTDTYLQVRRVTSTTTEALTTVTVYECSPSMVNRKPTDDPAKGEL